MASKMSSDDRRRRIRRLLERDGNLCHYCEKELTEADRTIEHIIPRSAPGGSNALENLVLACLTCNYARGDMEYHEFLRVRRNPSARFRRYGLTQTPFAELRL